MGAGRKTKTITVQEPYHPYSERAAISVRNMRPKDLCGVIFGCTNETMAECLSKQLFGLPIGHLTYVKNIRVGLPLFLFNYSDRMMHGIFEAASNGQKHINPFAWTDGSERTPYPAQVRVRTKFRCQPLVEKKFKNIIEKNYHTPHSPNHFWFELDKTQTKNLTALFKPSHSPDNSRLPPVRLSGRENCPSLPVTKCERKELVSASSTVTWKDIVSGKSSRIEVDSEDFENDSLIKTSSNDLDDTESKESVSDWEDLVDNVLNVCSGDSTSIANGSLDIEEKNVNSDSNGCIQDDIIDYDLGGGENNGSGKGTEGSCSSYQNGCDTIVEYSNASEVFQEHLEVVNFIKELKNRQDESNQEIQQLRKHLWSSERKIRSLEDRVKELELKTDRSKLVDESLDNFVQQYLGSEDVIYLIGGFNGLSWLSTLDSFSPSLDIITSLKPMNYARSYASSVALDGNIFVFGGKTGDLWFDSVECYNRRDDEWIFCPSMLRKKGSLSGVTFNGKIFAIGGGYDRECLSDVEIFDPAIGKWYANQPMLYKRSASAAAELDGVIYAIGGYNGHQYLRTAEKFDPREGFWMGISSMNMTRSSHALAVLNEKLYCFGGYDGEKMVSTAEVYEPRRNSWVMCEPMKFDRGYSAAAVVGNSLHAIGGISDRKDIVETVECYKEGAGWSNCGWKSIGKRSFCSAVVL